jgi:single-strand DNA-binding protein
MEETRMTKDLNRVQLLGHLGADPDLRTVDTGQTLATFSIATSHRWTDTQGHAQEATEWTRIVAWGRLAEIVGQYLQHGARVYLEGRLKTRIWDDPETAERRWLTEVVLEDLILLDRPRSDEVLDGDTAEAPAVPALSTAPDTPDGPRRRHRTPPGVQPRPPPDGHTVGAATGADQGAGRLDHASHPCL